MHDFQHGLVAVLAISADSWAGFGLARRGPAAIHFITLSNGVHAASCEAAATNRMIARTGAILLRGRKRTNVEVGHSLPAASFHLP